MAGELRPGARDQAEVRRQVVRSDATRRGTRGRPASSANPAGARSTSGRSRLIGRRSRACSGRPSPVSSTGLSPCQVSAGSTTSTAGSGRAAGDDRHRRCCRRGGAKHELIEPRRAGGQHERDSVRLRPTRPKRSTCARRSRTAPSGRRGPASARCTVRVRPGRNGVQRRLGGQVADRDAGVRRGPRRRRDARGEVAGVASGVGDVEPDQVRPGRRGTPVDLAVPDRRVAVPRRQEALDSRGPPGRSVR